MATAAERHPREINCRIRFLTKRLEISETVDPAGRHSDQVFFGATIIVLNGRGEKFTISIVGVDEIDTARGRVSWGFPNSDASGKG